MAPIVPGTLLKMIAASAPRAATFATFSPNVIEPRWIRAILPVRSIPATSSVVAVPTYTTLPVALPTGENSIAALSNVPALAGDVTLKALSTAVPWTSATGTLTPGATSSCPLPKLDQSANVFVSSTAPTAITVGSLAGKLTGGGAPWSFPLPALATSTMPRR